MAAEHSTWPSNQQLPSAPGVEPRKRVRFGTMSAKVCRYREPTFHNGTEWKGLRRSQTGNSNCLLHAPYTVLVRTSMDGGCDRQEFQTGFAGVPHEQDSAKRFDRNLLVGF